MEKSSADQYPPAPLPVLLGMAAVALGATLPISLAWGFLHPPRRLHGKNPKSTLGLAYERFRLRSRDGVKLSGWYIPAPVKTPAALVVVSHGYYGNRGEMLPHLEFLHQAGYAVVMYDFRAHGWSDGYRTTFGIQEPDDLWAVLDWTASHPDLKTLPLVLLGESMGASVSLLVAARHPEVRAVVADSAYARFDSAVRGRLELALGPVAPAVTAPAQRFGERLLGVSCSRIAPIEAVIRFAPRPVFLIHGLEDRLIIPENSRRILAASPGNASLWEVAGAAHVRSIHVARQEYRERVLAFLQKALA